MVADLLSELQAKLEEEAKQNRKIAHAEFVKAAWANRPAMELLKLANEAGMKIPDADTLIEVIRKGQENVVLADRLPRLKKEADEARALAEKTCERNNEVISRLREENRHVWDKNEAAFRSMCDADQAVRDLLLLFDKGLLPMPHREVTRLLSVRTAEEKSREAHTAWRKEEEAKDRFRSIVRNIERSLARLPLSVTLHRDRAELEKDLEVAKKNLAEAEKKVEAAKAFAEKMEKAIPS